jgi:hypothetical protein
MTIPFHLKRKFEQVNFLLKYHQKPQEMEHRKKRKKRENILKKEKRGRKRKALRVCSNKGKVNILSGKKHFNLSCDSIFSPSVIQFQKPLPKSMRKFS